MSRPEPYSACWTLADHVDRAATLWPDRDALIIGDARYTFEQFADATFEFARVLLALGVGPGDKVGVVMPSGIPAFTALYGAARLGAIGVPLDPTLRPAQLRDTVRDADAKVLITDNGDLKQPDAPLLEHLLGPSADLRALAEQVSAAAVRRLQRATGVGDTGLLLYPPPTEEHGPRACRLGHEGLIRVARMMGEQRFPLRPGERLFDPLPFAGLGALLPFNACLAVGATFVGMREFDAAEAATILARERCTHAFPAVEGIWAAILDQEPHLPDLWLVAVDGDPEALMETAERAPEVTQVTMYGTTEVGGLIALSQFDDPLELRVNCAGRPFHGVQVRILDLDTGAELPAGHQGRIAVKGWSLFQGYHKDSAEHLDPNGWLHTEDVGSVDASGRLFLGDVAFVG